MCADRRRLPTTSIARPYSTLEEVAVDLVLLVPPLVPLRALMGAV